jgi:hypothetical protein
MAINATTIVLLLHKLGPITSRPLSLSGPILLEWNFPHPSLKKFLKYLIFEMASKGQKKRLFDFKHEWLNLYGLQLVIP